MDRQVIAIALVEGASRIYADDKDLVGFARRLGMDAFSRWELPLPPVREDLFAVAGVSTAQLASKDTSFEPEAPPEPAT